LAASLAHRAAIEMITMNTGKAPRVFAIAFLLMLSQISCAANDASEDSSSMRDKIAALFTSSRVIALKYRPVSQLGPAPPTEQQLIEHWIYSASMNCVGDCGKKAKELQQYLASGKQADSACPPPFFAVLSFLSTDRSSETRIRVHASGHCFVFEDKSYVSDEAFTKFMVNNNITIFGQQEIP
jgi:hypothetical protein